MRKYWSIFKIQVINSLAYPGELVGRSLMIIPFLWIFYQLWSVTFRASGVDAINGLTLRDTLWYLMMAETIELGKSRIARTVAENVKDGSIAYLLNKPYNFLAYQLSSGLGESLPRMILLIRWYGTWIAFANSCWVMPIGIRNSSRSISPGWVGWRWVGMRTIAGLPSSQWRCSLPLSLREPQPEAISPARSGLLRRSIRRNAFCVVNAAPRNDDAA